MTVCLTVAGAGLIGRRHAQAIAAAEGVALAAIVDPSDAAAEVAAQYAVPHFRTLEEHFEAGTPDGVILATPNQAHVSGGMACIDALVPVLVEKPLADDLAEGQALVEAATAADVPLLTGHHRRHNPLIARAKQVIDEGRLGQITAVQGTCWLTKPDEYFQTEWRRLKGAGPVYLNLIHDVDLLRHLCGDITSVHAMESNAVRGHEVEETAAILLRFANGALGTVTVSDAVVAPWSWELTARENPAYPATPEDCYRIGGTQGALSLPNLSLWTCPEDRSWWAPIAATKLPFGFDDPLVRQVTQFAAVIRGEEKPLVSGLDGLAALRVIEAVKRSAETGQTITLPPSE